jgi:CheY-like chemotaxis protein
LPRAKRGKNPIVETIREPESRQQDTAEAGLTFASPIMAGRRWCFAAQEDVVLMDIQMPEMDGLKPQKNQAGSDGVKTRVPIVAMTAMR